MDVEMRMPDLATTGSPIKVLRWLVDVGQSVRRGEPLLEVETDKAVMQVESVISGCLSSVSAGEGDEVEAGKPIAIFETDRAGAAVAVGVEEARPATSETAPPPPVARIRDFAGAGRRESFFARNREARARRGRGPRSRARTIGPERSP
jgi:pyruvate dehydrogenase E2 component (dihydrolipoamide acetyltransferase)